MIVCEARFCEDFWVKVYQTSISRRIAWRCERDHHKSELKVPHKPLKFLLNDKLFSNEI